MDEAGSGELDLHTLVDGPAPAAARDVLAARGQIVSQERRGNGPSWRNALRYARDSSWPDEDLVYFVEDDYLHTPDALRILLQFTADSDAEYVTLYDHPDLYSRDDLGPATWIRFSAGRHWRYVQSTCMTFAARLGTLRKDFTVLYAAGAQAFPSDHLMWLALQGSARERLILRYERPLHRLRLLPGARRLGEWGARPRRRAPGRLIGPVPSLAAHLDLRAGLPPGVNWADVAAGVLNH